MKKAVKVIAIMLLAVLCLGAVGCSELGLNTEEEKECSHRYAVSVKEATAEEDGLKTLMCTKCGYTVTEIIPAGESEEEAVTIYQHKMTWTVGTKDYSLSMMSTCGEQFIFTKIDNRYAFVLPDYDALYNPRQVHIGKGDGSDAYDFYNVVEFDWEMGDIYYIENGELKFTRIVPSDFKDEIEVWKVIKDPQNDYVMGA